MRYNRGSDGKYYFDDGSVYDMLKGSRAQVWHGTAYKTSYGKLKPHGDALTKRHLKKNKHNRIVSALKSGKGKMLLKRLHDKGYYTRKGKFGYVRRSARKRRSGTRRVTITEKRNRRTGRFSKGGRR